MTLDQPSILIFKKFIKCFNNLAQKQKGADHESFDLWACQGPGKENSTAKIVEQFHVFAHIFQQGICSTFSTMANKETEMGVLAKSYTFLERVGAR